MVAIAPRVDKLETRVSEHDTRFMDHQAKLTEHDHMLNGIGDCPGVVGEVEDIKNAIIKINLLLNSQTIYNKILTFFASALSLAVLGYLVKIILK